MDTGTPTLPSTEERPAGAPVVRTGPRFPSAVHRFSDLLARQPRDRLWFVCVGASGIVASGDLLTGYELAWSIFYLIPVSIAAWYLGWRASLIFVAAGTVLWFMSDLATGAEYRREWVRYWNGFVLAIFLLVVAVTVALLRSALAAERELARQDSLTGLANARAFHEAAAHQLALTKRWEGPLTIAFLDVDRFKHVNDTQGHSSGDDLLKAIGRRLIATTRLVDTTARLGGDEFALLLPSTPAAGARVVLDRVLATLNATVKDRWDVGFSMGAVAFQSPPASVDEMLHAADTVMYRVKQEGGSAVVVEERP